MSNAAIHRIACLAVTLGLAVDVGSGARQSSVDPFAFFAPDVVVSKSDRRRLDRDEVIARTLHGDDGQVALFVATRLKASPDVLVAWTRAIVELKRSKFVLAAGRFSDPPTISDLDGLTLESRDLERIRECIPGNCGLKLSAPEIASLRRVAARAGADWVRAAQAEFRRLLLARVNLYREGGLAVLPPTADRTRATHLNEAFSAIVAKSPYLTRVPKVADWLTAYPGVNDPSIESLFYWSKESYGTGKPVISVTHVGIVRPKPDRRVPAILVTGKQILATHYLDGSLGLTLILRDAETGIPYLVYLNRSRVDLLSGFFGGLIRGVLEGRLEREAPPVIRALRSRLEGGMPVGSALEPLSPR